MKRTKKLLFVLIALFAISSASYAFEFSLGYSIGGGLSFLEKEENVENKELWGFRNSIDLMFEFIPYLALETGLEIKFIESSDSSVSKWSVPLMLRGQYEYNLGVTYASAGVKFALLNAYTDFTMDASFAVGQEFRLGKANYLGIRIAYDLNVVKYPGTRAPLLFLPSREVSVPSDLNFSITYRYAFGSKWKK